MRDERLMELIESDPERGMQRLVSEYSGLVFAIVRGKLRPPAFREEDIEECAADAFSEFWKDRGSVDPAKGSVKSYLAKLALNNALDRLRSARNRPELLPLDEGVDHDGLSLEGEFMEKAERRELLDAIEALGDRDREIIVRKFFFGQSSKEIGERLGLTASNVDTRTHRAIKKLRESFGGKQ